jgi:hypothetical protein
MVERAQGPHRRTYNEYLRVIVKSIDCGDPADPTERGERPAAATKAWSLEDFENGVSGAATMLTVVAAEKRRREYLNQAKVMLKWNSR